MRRQTDVGGQVITLGRLLAEIGATPEILTRARYVSMFPAGMQWHGDREFDEFAAAGGATVDPDLVDRDRRELSRRSESIRRYVDKQLAHFEALKSDAMIPTFADLDAAIDALGSTFRKYAGLLTGADRPIMEPVPQYDWLAPFRIPWITA